MGSGTSVIIPTRGRRGLLEEAVRSALGQSRAPLEVLVVDDGTGALSFDDARVRVLPGPRRGRSAARNLGIREARGEFVAFLDDDDLWTPHKLRHQMDLLERHPEAGLVHTFTDVVDVKGQLDRTASRDHARRHKEAFRRGYTYSEMARRCVLFTSCVLIRSRLAQDLEGFDVSLDAVEDWDLYLRAALRTTIATIPMPLVHYRSHEGQTRADLFLRDRIAVARKHLALIDQGHVPGAGAAERSYFHAQIADAFYVAGERGPSRRESVIALRLNPSLVLTSRLGVHALSSLFPRPG